MTAPTDDKDSLSDIYGVRFGKADNEQLEDKEEESLTPVADEEIRHFEEQSNHEGRESPKEKEEDDKERTVPIIEKITEEILGS